MLFPANSYVIRRATDGDAQALRELAQLDSQRVIGGPALIGEIDGRPAAAISLTDGRVTADPFQPTTQLTAHLRLRARTLAALAKQPSLRERIYAGVRIAGALRPQN